jgi:hypothetical protein
MRENNEQYYPGKKVVVEKQESRQDIDMSTVSETEWSIMKKELLEAREIHQEYMKKI